MALLGVGYRSISMSPAAIGPVKAMLAELPLEALTALMDDTLNAPTCEKDVRAMLAAFAAENDIPL
jgi:phosphotransferase system enzyme I (PtsP)